MQSSSEVRCFYYTSVPGIPAINSMNYKKMLISSAIKNKQSFHYTFFSVTWSNFSEVMSVSQNSS